MLVLFGFVFTLLIGNGVVSHYGFNLHFPNG